MTEQKYSQTPLIRPSLIRLNGSPPGNASEQTSLHRIVEGVEGSGGGVYSYFWLIRLSYNPPKIVHGPMGADSGGLTVY